MERPSVETVSLTLFLNPFFVCFLIVMQPSRLTIRQHTTLPLAQRLQMG